MATADATSSIDPEKRRRRQFCLSGFVHAGAWPRAAGLLAIRLWRSMECWGGGQWEWLELGQPSLCRSVHTPQEGRGGWVSASKMTGVEWRGPRSKQKALAERFVLRIQMWVPGVTKGWRLVPFRECMFWAPRLPPWIAPRARSVTAGSDPSVVFSDSQVHHLAISPAFPKRG